ncbi:porin [Herbaspirillum rubrisubalbicans]|uniref:Porin n=1 Tax=Herbaspirillum rubrisubalbicans TaxID=80842 RepID=A0AAD0XF52_9BURK|nr:porin [Herbaspirillum rubrisubalbicans]ALU88011.1 porin signal peptide protein [Herbaspirillum rubrisubalbicans M1]AYR23092.1 porin [Herbaspirillum rubrisubalbicans]
MKKSILALAVLGAFGGAAHAQSNITIYGAVDASLSYTNKIGISGKDAHGNDIAGKDTGGQMALDSGLIKGSRLGIKGVEDLGGGLKAIFTIENGFNVDSGDAGQKGVLWGRQATVGLSGNFGTVLAGRQKDVLDDVGSITSPGDFGGVVSRVHSLNLDRTNGERVNNSIRYNTPDFNGFIGSVIYGFGEQAGKTGSGQSFGLGGTYANGPLNVGLGYFQSKMGNANASDVNGASACNGPGKNGDTCLKTWTLAASYQFGPAKVYGSYSHVRLPLTAPRTRFDSRFDSFAAFIDPKKLGLYQPAAKGDYTIGGANNESSQTFDIGVNYRLSPALSLISSLQYTRAKFVRTSDGRLLQVNLGAKYELSKRTTTYAVLRNLRSSDMYNVGLSSDRVPGANRGQTGINAGLIHSF